MQRVLADRHDVLTAIGGRAGLAALSTRDVAPDVVICDVEMDELSGPALWREIAARRPRLLAGFVFMSAGVLDVAHRELLEQIGRPLLEKPFRIEALRELVARELARQTRLRATIHWPHRVRVSPSTHFRSLRSD